LDVVPSVHVTVFLAFVFAAAVAFESTPPCPEQAPRPVADDVDPSVHTLAADDCAAAGFETKQSAARAAAPSRKRMCMGGLRKEVMRA
jgi:hypothetical protein